MTAQESEVFNIEDCPNYNNFLDIDESMDSIWNYVTEIRPGGRMMFKPEVFTSEEQYDHFLSFLNLDPNVTFEFVTEHPNRHYPDKSFLRYQQYIDGIPIEGGGVVVSGIFAPGQGPGGPAGPCARLGMMVPHIANDVTISTTPAISDSQAMLSIASYISEDPDSIIQDSATLVVSRIIEGDCNYILSWRIDYHHNGPYTAWVDANEGNVLKIVSGVLNFDARTQIYGDVDNIVQLDNIVENGELFLISPDGLYVYDLRNWNCGNSSPNKQNHYISSNIPTTTNQNWLQLSFFDQEMRGIMQAFYVTQQLIPIFDDIGIEFNQIHLATNCHGIAGYNVLLSRRFEDKDFLFIGKGFGDFRATFDIIGHELGHAYVHNYIDSDRRVNASLHEGFADIIGTFVEFKFKGNVDWIMGGDLNSAHDNIKRDLQNPDENCFTDVKDSGVHPRSLPLGHLFYLLAEGSSSLGITSLGMDTAFNLLMGALPELNDDSDYKQLMHATLSLAYEVYGVCSDEYNALVKAWTYICLDTEFKIIRKNSQINFSECEYFTFGTLETCWNSDNAQICLNLPDSINHGVNPNHITWTITGPGSSDFESAAGMQGNQQQGGTCLKIISIPELEYYPRRVNIRVDFTTEMDGSMTLNHSLLMQDCTGTKPDCETYHGQKVIAENDKIDQDEQTDFSEMVDENNSTMEVYDLLGRLLYQGQVMGLNHIDLPLNQVLIIRYLGKNGQVNKTHKTIKVR